MRKILLLAFMVLVMKTAVAVCTSPISRTNFSPLTVLTSTKLNADLNALYTQVNELPGDCVTDETITSAKIKDGEIVNADISDSAAIALSKIVSNMIISSSDSDLFSTTSTTLTDVTNLSVSITTTGRPVEIFLVPKLSTSDIGVIGVLGIGSSFSATLNVAIDRDGTTVSNQRLYVATAGSAAITETNAEDPCSVIRHIETPVAGTYTYKLRISVNNASDTGFVNYCRLVAREL